MTQLHSRDHLSANLLLDPEVIEHPHAFHRCLVDTAPVWRVPGTEIVVVSSFAAVSEAVQRVDDFSSNMRAIVYSNDRHLPELLPFDAGDADTLATADPPVHTIHRRAVFPELVARRMSSLRPDVEQLAAEHVCLTLGRSRVEVMGGIANVIPIRVVSKLIGFRNEDPDQLLAAALAATEMLAAARPLSDVMAAMERTSEVFMWIAEQLQKAIDEGGGEGILQAIGTAVGRNELDVDAGIVIMHTLLSAAGESTTSLLGNAIHLLAHHRELQDRLRVEPDLVTPFIEEVVRLESPFQYHLRHVARDTELHGVTVPAGATMLLFWGAANRDPAVYDRPDEVVLDRSAPRHHVGFGRGIHLCVGAPLARLEAEVVLRRLLDHTGAFTLDPNDPPVRVSSLMVRRFSSLPLIASLKAPDRSG
jgi:cytochrome P450